jgi:hypothetical protein
MIHKIIIEYDSEDIDPIIALESIKGFEMPWIKSIKGGV